MYTYIFFRIYKCGRKNNKQGGVFQCKMTNSGADIATILKEQDIGKINTLSLSFVLSLVFRIVFSEDVNTISGGLTGLQPPTYIEHF